MERSPKGCGDPKGQKAEQGVSQGLEGGLGRPEAGEFVPALGHQDLPHP